MKKVFVILCAMALVFAMGGTALAIPIGGIEFPDGAISFADLVLSYNPGSDVAPPYSDPNAALGIPDYIGPDGATASGAASLGDGGSLILQFTNNSLTTSGDANPDLHIFEVGDGREWFNVSISMDASTWIDLGDVRGQTASSSIDIDSITGVTPGALYSFVRLMDDASVEQSGSPYGEADIDAVGAISSAPPVPEPTTMLLLGTGFVGLAGFGRRIFKR